MSRDYSHRARHGRFVAASDGLSRGGLIRGCGGSGGNEIFVLEVAVPFCAIVVEVVAIAVAVA